MAFNLLYVKFISLQTEHLNAPMYLYTLWTICNSLTGTSKGTAFHLALETNNVVITSTVRNVSSTDWCWWWGIPGLWVGENRLGALS